MTRTRKPTPTVQPGLFDSVDVHALADQVTKLQQQVERLKKENRGLARYNARLRAEYDQLYQTRLGDAEHPLHTECKRLRKEVDGLRATCGYWCDRALGLRGQPAALDKHAFHKLLSICHPDKWHNQPAEKLAHELAVVINSMRQGTA